MSASTDTFMLQGGLNLVAPYLAIAPGQCVAGLNFEPGLTGGYRRIAGYERLDGRPRPHLQTYTALEVASVASYTVGALVTGGTSGATGRVAAIDATLKVLAVTQVVGTFQIGEALGASTIVDFYSAEDTLDDTFTLAAQAYARGNITTVPGSGPVRGVWQHNGTTLAFRNNAGGTACIPHKSTASGWSALSLGHVVRYDTGTAAINVGDTVTNGAGATALVKKVIKYSGAYGTGDAAGYLVLSGLSGSFANNDPIKVGAPTLALADGASAAISFAPNGTFQFISHNFFGGVTTFNVYGCDGVNPAFEWDGTTLSPILMPTLAGAPATNNPHRIIQHAGHLFLGFPGGSCQHSVVGEPLLFSGFLGAAEFGVGAEITDLLEQAGDVLLIYTRRSTFGLYGTGIDNWVLKPVAPEQGCIARTAQLVIHATALDDRGLTEASRSQAYGNFESATISRTIQPFLDSNLPAVVGSTVVRRSNQYRLFLADGSFLIAYMPGGDAMPEFMLAQYPVGIHCLGNAEGSDGQEVLLLGGTDGYVYEAEVGSNFDGAEITSFLRLPFNYAKNSRIRKRYRRGQLDLEAQGVVQLSFSAELSYGNADTLQPENFADRTVFGGGGYWDGSNWDEIYWDGQTISNALFDLDGTGTNLAMSFIHRGAATKPFTLHSLQIDYENRRRER